MRARSRVAADAATRAADKRHLRRWVGRGAGGERHNSGGRGGAWRNYSACARRRGGDRMWRRSPVCKEMGARRGRSSAASGVVVRRGRCADDPCGRPHWSPGSLLAWPAALQLPLEHAARFVERRSSGSSLRRRAPPTCRRRRSPARSPGGRRTRALRRILAAAKRPPPPFDAGAASGGAASRPSARHELVDGGAPPAQIWAAAAHASAAESGGDAARAL